MCHNCHPIVGPNRDPQLGRYWERPTIGSLLCIIVIVIDCDHPGVVFELAALCYDLTQTTLHGGRLRPSLHRSWWKPSSMLSSRIDYCNSLFMAVSAKILSSLRHVYSSAQLSSPGKCSRLHMTHITELATSRIHSDSLQDSTPPPTRHFVTRPPCMPRWVPPSPHSCMQFEVWRCGHSSGQSSRLRLASWGFHGGFIQQIHHMRKADSTT